MGSSAEQRRWHSISGCPVLLIRTSALDIRSRFHPEDTLPCLRAGLHMLLEKQCQTLT